MSLQNFADRQPTPRRTPRRSLIVVLADASVLPADRLAQRLPSPASRDTDVIIACAGPPADLDVLHRTVGEARFLLAPSGTSRETLRELAMRQAPGDIVTLVEGTSLSATTSHRA